MGKKSATGKPAHSESFPKLLSQDPELSDLRSSYARKSPSQRRKAAEWAYDESIAMSLFGAAAAHIQGEGLTGSPWPPGFAALAIDPDYAPALLSVGGHEYRCGRQSEGMSLLLRLTQLPADTPDLLEIIDEAGDFLMDASDPANTCLLYEEALKVQPDEHEFVIGLGWALCRAGRQVEALPWLEKALAKAPQESSLLNDYGWALTELGRFDEAQPILEKAVRFAPPGYVLPSNNLKRLRQLRGGRSRLS